MIHNPARGYQNSATKYSKGRLDFDPKPLCDTVYEVHVRSGKVYFQDGPVRKPRNAQGIDIFIADERRIECQFTSVTEHCALGRGQAIPVRTAAEGIYQVGISRKTEQTCSVVEYSIMTAIGGGYRNRNHFAMCPAKFAGSVHSRLINLQMRFKDLRRQTVDF